MDCAWLREQIREFRNAPERHGNYRCLLEGASNISLTKKIVHFELSYIPEAAKPPRAVGDDDRVPD